MGDFSAVQTEKLISETLSLPNLASLGESFEESMPVHIVQKRCSSGGHLGSLGSSLRSLNRWAKVDGTSPQVPNTNLPRHGIDSGTKRQRRYKRTTQKNQKGTMLWVDPFYVPTTPIDRPDWSPTRFLWKNFVLTPIRFDSCRDGPRCAWSLTGLLYQPVKSLDPGDRVSNRV